MMFEKSRAVENVSSFLKDLDGAASKLTEISGKSSITPQEMKELMKVLQHVNGRKNPD